MIFYLAVNDREILTEIEDTPRHAPEVAGKLFSRSHARQDPRHRPRASICKKSSRITVEIAAAARPGAARFLRSRCRGEIFVAALPRCSETARCVSLLTAADGDTDKTAGNDQSSMLVRFLSVLEIL